MQLMHMRKSPPTLGKIFKMKHAQFHVSPRYFLEPHPVGTGPPQFKTKRRNRKGWYEAGYIENTVHERVAGPLQCRGPTAQSTAKDGESCFVRGAKGRVRETSGTDKVSCRTPRRSFRRHRRKAERKTCRAMKGLIEEGSEILQEEGEESESVIDAGIIVAA